jgi:hypothetical protein
VITVIPRSILPSFSTGAKIVGTCCCGRASRRASGGRNGGSLDGGRFGGGAVGGGGRMCVHG